VDQGEKTQVKHAYLHEALFNPEPENPTTKVHIRTVFGQLEQSPKKYFLVVGGCLQVTSMFSVLRLLLYFL
jgi:hypothetical protein